MQRVRRCVPCIAPLSNCENYSIWIASLEENFCEPKETHRRNRGVCSIINNKNELILQSSTYLQTLCLRGRGLFPGAL